MMSTEEKKRKKSVRITDKKTLSKAINKYNYLIVIIISLFIILDYDMLNTKPKFIVLEPTLVYIILIFQVIFIISLYTWHLKKQKTFSILNNGITAKGNYLDTVSVKANSKSKRFYLHTYEYIVSGKKYKIVLKDFHSIADKSTLIIYNSKNAKKSLVYNELSKAIKSSLTIQ